MLARKVDIVNCDDTMRAMAEQRPIPALWFDAKGYGPSELALQLHPFAAEKDGAIPASLGLRIRMDQHEFGAMAMPNAAVLIDSGFNLGREQVYELHRALGEWLAATSSSGASAHVPEKRNEVADGT